MTELAPGQIWTAMNAWNKKLQLVVIRGFAPEGIEVSFYRSGSSTHHIQRDQLGTHIDSVVNAGAWEHKKRIGELEQLHTRELLDYLNLARKFNGFYSPWGKYGGYSFEQIKTVLATREHIPNKAEARRARQEQARMKKHR